MTTKIRAATPSDLSSMVDLLIWDAEQRQDHNPTLWRLANDAPQRTMDAVTFALMAEKQPFRQQWLVAESGGKLVGIVHTMRLPVPPIYVGKWGDPGLLMPETFVTQDAPKGTLMALLDAAEADLRASGAALLLASLVCGDELKSALLRRGYDALTLYFSKSGLEPASHPASVRAATEQDIDGIVTRSAENRAVLQNLNAFWTVHPEADARFGNWMTKSLTFTDRNIIVSGSPEAVDGYAVAQSASRLHFPPAHDISATGVIDDFCHRQYADPAAPLKDNGALALLQAAEAAFSARGVTTSFIVCPAAWTSKIALLEKAGYIPAMVWLIKR